MEGLMDITALGYVGISSAKLDDWSALATGLLGMQQVDRAKAVRAFRMDDRKQRLVIDDEGHEGLGFISFEVADAAALDRVATRIEAAGTPVKRGSRSVADERHVADLVVFHDPGGHRIEIFHGAETAASPFVPGRAISGFRTGPLGMGHVVLNVDSIDRLLPFYRDVLGFGVSDYGLEPYPLYFFHVNARHHSFAMVGSGRSSIHHFMVELFSLDDVGQGYDLAQLEPGRIAYTLGRHTNDHMTSFYTTTPTGFFIEYGWGGLSIDPNSWQPHRTTNGPTLWGHERVWLPDDNPDRLKLREMRLDAAARGVREPVHVVAGNHVLAPGACPWLDTMARR
jgi:2,3-dihydroxybiphenyl 1,2-dioxygenase